jgi:hypothetical protein
LKKRIFYPVGLLAGFLLILIFLSGPILNRAGDFLAPFSKENAEVVILEGTETIRNGVVREGVDLLQNSKTRRLVVVMHLHEKEGQLFAIQEEYPRMLRKKLKTLGLREEQLEIILVPINDHPITLTEARFVMAVLAKEGVRSAVLVSEGFHTRRSWAVYRQEGEGFKISVKPHPCFINYKKENWWKQKEGIRDFVQESSKLVYYLVFGYVSPRFVFDL